jgi:hypothetical protein
MMKVWGEGDLGKGRNWGSLMGEVIAIWLRNDEMGSVDDILFDI